MAGIYVTGVNPPSFNTAMAGSTMQDGATQPLREDTLLADLSRLPWTKGLDEAALQEIHPTAYIRYSIVHRQIQDLQDLLRLLEKELD